MNLLPPRLVKSALASHSWLGLMIGGLMYIVCLSGTLSIFYEEIERWEQPILSAAGLPVSAVLTCIAAGFLLGTGIRKPPRTVCFPGRQQAPVPDRAKSATTGR